MEAIGLVTEVGKCIGAPIKLHLNYLCCFRNNIQNLDDEAQKLKDKDYELQRRVDAAKNNSQVIFHEVETWLDNARKSKDKINGIKNDVPKVQKGCLNLISCYSLSRRAKKTVEDLRKLCNDCKFDQISQDAPLATRRSFRWGPKEEFETRKKIEEDVMEALRDKNFNKIGLCGMGGIGKTTMAERIMDRVKEEKLFDGALKVVVSQEVEMLKIQQHIANQLGLSLDAEDLATRAYKIHTRLRTMKTTLVVLDDVWERLKLEDLGIPCKDTFDSCNVLYTSRDHSVLEEMETQKIFSLQVLSDSEARSLSTKRIDNSANIEDLCPIAENVAKECKGLPVAPVTVGGALRNKANQQLWEDALLQLRRSNPTNLPRVLADVYNPLKLSYEFLGSQHAKSLFLLCSMFEEDVDIGLGRLTWCGMGLNMFEGLGNWTEARNRTCSLIELLKDRSLLLDGFDKDYVKTHDVVRDMAIYTASEGNCDGFVIDFDRRSWENCPKDCFWISVINLSDETEFPTEFKCLSSRLLMMQGGKKHFYIKLLTLPDNFFDGMQEIRVLSVEDIYVRSLPPTSQLLKNLRTLRLFKCHDLESITVVGELSNLEILSCIGCDDIEALPTEIGRLNHLRLLEIIRCRNLKRIAHGVISNLISLEELTIKGSFRGWEPKESANTEENAALVELEPLTKLTCLDIEINNASLVAEEICLPSQIVKYHIAIMETKIRPIIMGKDPEYFQLPYCRTMWLEIPGREMNVGNWIKTLLRRTEFLCLQGDGANQLINLVELEKLKILNLHSCSSVKTLVNTTSVFRLLETLILGGFGREGLVNLEEIMDSHNLHMAFPNLKYLELCRLPRLVIAQETLDKIVAPDNLRELILDSLNFDAISGIWCVFSSFRNLEHVDIYRMNGIKNLMSSSIAIKLVHLRTLLVSECKMMLEVIANDDEAEAGVQEISQVSLFPHLETIYLDCLPKLRSFCQWDHHNTTLELLSLEHVEIIGCPKMETFAQQSVSIPKLRKGRVGWIYWSGVVIKVLNETIQYYQTQESKGGGRGGGGVSSSSSW